jgi:PTS system trehalose-specific IIC component
MEITRESVEQIVAAVGGRENIATATHCVTRLRFVLKDEGAVKKDELNRIEIVKGAFAANGQYQVVIGPGLVEKAYAQLVAITGIDRATQQEVKAVAQQRLGPLQRAIRTLADIFIPILPAIVTAGLLMGINNVLTGPGIFYAGRSIVDVHPGWRDLADMINVIANTAFVFLPGLIGWSAAKRFGASELLGIVLGLMLVHPALLNAWGYGEALQKGTVPYWHLFGLPIRKIGYQGQVLPILVATYVLARVERWVTSWAPDALKLLLVAPITLLVTGFLSFVAIGPITFAIGNALTAAVVTLFGTFPLVGGLIYGLLYAPLVITGMHHTFLAVDIQLIGTTGSTFLWPILVLSNIAQGSAALAMIFASRDKRLRGISLTSAISAYLGITEPAMFGVNLPHRFPFIAAMIGSALGAAVLTVRGVRAASIGVGGLPGFLSILPRYWGSFFIGMAIALVVPFVLTFVIAKGRGQGAADDGKVPAC